MIKRILMLVAVATSLMVGSGYSMKQYDYNSEHPRHHNQLNTNGRNILNERILIRCIKRGLAKQIQRKGFLYAVLPTISKYNKDLIKEIYRDFNRN